MSGSSERRLGRRRALVGFGLAATGAAAGLPGLAAGQRDDRRPGGPSDVPPTDEEARPMLDADAAHDLHPADPTVERLFGSLRPGTLLEGHWRIERLHGLRAGAIPVVLSARDGSRFAAEVFRADADGPTPVGDAGPLALYLVNRGDGDAATDEVAGLGVQALARALRGRLDEGAEVPDALVTHATRRRAHPAGVFHVPLEQRER